MSCAAKESTFIRNKHEYEIKCPNVMCNGIWELEECSEAIDMSDVQYEYHAEDSKISKLMNQNINHRYNTNYGNINDNDDHKDYVMPDKEIQKQTAGQQPKHDRNKKDKTAASKMGAGIIGLPNLGNTCYMNSALQCLLQCPSFVELFFYNKIKLPTKSKRFGGGSVIEDSTSYIWASFIKEIYGAKYSIAPNQIKNALNRLNPVIGNGSQEDAFCVIETLLNGLDAELFTSNPDGIYHEEHVFKEKDVPSQQKINSIVNKLWASHTKEFRSDSAVIRELFDGVQCEKLTCPDCNYQLRAYQNFRHISLPLVNKNITLNMKVYIPEIAETTLKSLNFTLAFDNTAHGLKYIVLAQLGQGFLQKYNMNKENVDIRFGYIHPSNNDASEDVNGWIKYMNNGNCANIKNASSIFAIISRRGGKFKFIPTFNLIVDDNHQHVDDVIDLLTFTKINASCNQIPGNDMINCSSKIPQNQQLSDYDPPIIYYNNRLITNNKNHTIKIVDDASLLRIWIHRDYPKNLDSPKNANIDMNANDHGVIQRALNTSSNTNMSWEFLMNILKEYWTKLSTYINQCGEQWMQNETKNAKSVYEKLKQLTDSEKLANEWLSIKIDDMMEQHETQKINYTKPKMLDNLSECLKVYEMKETSDGNGVDCQRCAECPEIASRQVDIIKTPQILTIHIDREQAEFNQSAPSKKRDNLIKYPITDLKFANDVYDLFGVVEHYGWATDWGHYVCYVKGLQDQEWHEMNDRTTSDVYNKRDIITKDASVLLYHKKSMKSMNE